MRDAVRAGNGGGAGAASGPRLPPLRRAPSARLRGSARRPRPAGDVAAGPGREGRAGAARGSRPQESAPGPGEGTGRPLPSAGPAREPALSRRSRSGCRGRLRAAGKGPVAAGSRPLPSEAPVAGRHGRCLRPPCVPCAPAAAAGSAGAPARNGAVPALSRPGRHRPGPRGAAVPPQGLLPGALRVPRASRALRGPGSYWHRYCVCLQHRHLCSDFLSCIFIS